MEVRTDKIEYEQGEKIRVIIKNNLNQSIWYEEQMGKVFDHCFLKLPSKVQKLENEKWDDIELPHKCCNELMCRIGSPIKLKLEPKTKREIELKIPSSGTYRLKFVYYLSNDTRKENYAYSNEFEIKAVNGITITMNKTVFLKGEKIDFRIDGKVHVCTNKLPFSIIKSDGEPVRLKHSCAGFVGSGVDQYCENGKIVSKRIYQLCNFSRKWCYGCSDLIACWDTYIHENFTWDQKEYVEITEVCDNRTIHREIKKFVPSGIYKIVVYDVVNQEYVESEFTIKAREPEWLISTYGKCKTDEDCYGGGCSGEICQSRFEEPQYSICIVRQIPANFYCRCIDGKCQWVSNTKK